MKQDSDRALAAHVGRASAVESLGEHQPSESKLRRQTEVHHVRLTSDRRPKTATYMEQAMWDEYDANSMAFDAGTSVDEEQDHERHRIESQLDHFGQWNEHSLGRTLGAGCDEFTPNEDDEEDELLAEILQSTRK